MALAAAGLLAGPLLLCATAQDNKTAAPAPNQATKSAPATVAANAKEKSNLGEEPAAAPLSPEIQQILKMADAGVSKPVVLAFIERSSTAYQPTADDLIALKKHGIADEVTTALLRRGAQVKAQTEEIRGTPIAPAIVSRLSTGGYLDPESYEFWQYHYAYPRALAYSYRTLAPYDTRYRLGITTRFPSASRFPTTRYGWR